MEDAHSFVVDFDSVRGQGFFAVFDGHAGKHAAEWCGIHFHEVSRGIYYTELHCNSLNSISLQVYMRLLMYLSPTSSTQHFTRSMRAFRGCVRNPMAKYILDVPP